MKKRNLKTLSLKKNTISSLKLIDNISGGGTKGCHQTDGCTQITCNPLTITTCDHSIHCPTSRISVCCVPIKID